MLSAGAYGMSMASTYNSRCRAAEVIVDGVTCIASAAESRSKI